MPMEEFRWNYDAIIVGLDPVAVDTVGADIIRQKRDQIKAPSWPLAPDPVQLKTAKSLGLGENDLKKIKIIEMTI